MDYYVIKGNRPLKGKVYVSGSKNAVLPIMAATLLCKGKCIIKNVPRIQDVITMCKVLESLGAETHIEDDTLIVNTTGDITTEAHYDMVRKMRASFVVLGPLLARYKKAKVSYPGGCAIGTRPVNLHLNGLTQLGAQIVIDHGYLNCSIPDKLVGKRIFLDYPSVGATQNIMMAAVLAEGVTTIENSSREPEVEDLADFLNYMGARVEGAGSDIITITGVKDLHETTYKIIPDRIEACTFMITAAITRSCLNIQNVCLDHIEAVITKLEDIGAVIALGNKEITVDCSNIDCIRSTKLKTLPFPGIPTDMQPQFMALLSLARGTSIISESVFENRFTHVPELLRMGADLSIEGASVFINGTDKFTGADVMASDLRAGAGLVLAGLAADGITRINRIYHIDRGYENLHLKLQRIGADIERFSEK